MEHIFNPQERVPITGIASKMDIRFGESTAAEKCLNCGGFKQAGLFIVINTSKVILLCIHCIVKCVLEYQRLHPLDHLIELDANVAPSVFEKCVEEARKVRPDISQYDMERIVRAAIDVL